MIRHIYTALPLKYGNIVHFWVGAFNMMSMQWLENILKEATRLVVAKPASSKCTNQQPCTVWSLIFAFSVLLRHVTECPFFNSLGIVYYFMGLFERSTSFKKNGKERSQLIRIFNDTRYLELGSFTIFFYLFQQLNYCDPITTDIPSFCRNSCLFSVKTNQYFLNFFFTIQNMHF